MQKPLLPTTLRVEANAQPRRTSRARLIQKAQGRIPRPWTRSPTGRSGGPRLGSTTSRTSSSASELPSKPYKSPSILTNSPLNRVVQFKAECRCSRAGHLMCSLHGTVVQVTACVYIYTQQGVGVGTQKQTAHPHAPTGRLGACGHQGKPLAVLTPSEAGAGHDTAP